MAAFIRRVKTASGATAVQIMEKHGQRNKLVEHVGSAHTPEQLELLMEAARRKLAGPDQDMLNFGDSKVSPGEGFELTVGAQRSLVAWRTLENVYSHLGFDVLDDEAFKQLVLARVIEPASKLETVRILSRLGISSVYINKFYRCLQRAATRDYRDRLAKACYEYAIYHGDMTLLLFDVTTLYFEAEKEDDPLGPNEGLRRVGYSKERRVDPQIVVGMLVDRTGMPLEIDCFEGHRAETHTLVPIIKRFQQRHNLANFVVVADAGMLSQANMKALDDENMFFIVGSRITKAPGDLESHFRWNGNMFEDGQIVDTVTPKHANSIVNNPNIKTEPVWDPKMKNAWRAVWAFSKKRYSRDCKTLDQQRDRALAIISGKKPAKKARFIKGKPGTLTFDEKTYEKALRLAGLKGYVTNLPATVMPASEVITSYHDLWKIEQSFRMSKTDLRARPIYHHTRDAIEAHLTVVMAALAVSRHIHTTTGITAKPRTDQQT